jgi:transcription antitermination factor NusG
MPDLLCPAWVANVLWFALQVKQRYEQSTAWALRNKGYEEFLPLYKCRHRWSDRIKQLDRVLFPGYLFCKLDPNNRLPILTTPGVLLIVGIGKTPVPVEESEITAVRSIVASQLPAQPWPFLRAGQRVCIDAGPLRGLEGMFLNHRNQCRLVVSVTLLQRSVAVEVDSDWVTPLKMEPHPAWTGASQWRAIEVVP